MICVLLYYVCVCVWGGGEGGRERFPASPFFIYPRELFIEQTNNAHLPARSVIVRVP